MYFRPLGKIAKNIVEQESFERKSLELSRNKKNK